MRIKLTPKMAYLTGLWKARRIRAGVGIAANDETQQVFISEVMETLKVPPEKIRVDGANAFFYHSAYRKYMEGLVQEELETFKWKNELSASFVAGIFDGCGGVDEERGAVFFARMTDADQFLLERLGFQTRRMRGKVFIAVKSLPGFVDFIAPHLKTGIKLRLSALMRSGNERDPR